jgi:hypothetical protein
MEPIISPWFIYLLDVSLSLSVVLGVASIIGVITLIVVAINAGEEQEERPAWFKKGCWIVIVVVAVFVVIPSRSAIIGMLIAQKATPDNIKTLILAGKDFKNEIKGDIMEMIEASKEEKKK